MLFVGDDWAEEHHDIELQDVEGTVLVHRRLPEGVAGITALHELIGEHSVIGPDATLPEVVVGIETDRGPWVQATAGGRFPGLCHQPDVGSEVSRASCHLGGQERPR